MASFLNQQLTDVGWDALSVALGGGRLTFFKLQAGSGTIANDDAIPPMTTLNTPICDIAITSYVIEGDGQITLFGNISSEQLTAGFNFKELGVFAVIEDPVAGQGGTPSGANISAIEGTPSTLANPVVPPPGYGTPLMYSYANSYAAADYIPGAGESTDVVNTIQVTVKIDKAPNVQINVLEGQQMSVVNIGPPTVGAGPWSYTDANVAYLKRLVAGPLTDIHEDANTITIGQKQLLTDLDLYVANGNPDISPNFSSIQKALDYLGQYIIPTTVKARIHVSAGTYVSSNTINVTHPNGQSITIQGPQNNTVQGTSLSITGSASNWNMAINGISNTSQFVVNDWAIIDNVGGTTSANNPLATGFFQVLSKTASSVTVRVSNPKSSFSITGTTSIRITPISVVLTCSTVNREVLYVGSYGVGLFQYIGVLAGVSPTLSMTGVAIGGDSSLKFIGVGGFDMVINANSDNMVVGISANAAVSCLSCACTNNQNGFGGNGNCSFRFENCAATYNRNIGIWLEQANAYFVKAYNFIGGNYHGMVVGSNGTFIVFSSVPLAYVICQCNDAYGLLCHSGGSLTFSTTACTLWLQNNGISLPTKYDVVVQNYGMVSGSAGIVGSRIFNATVGVITSTGGLIN